MIYLPILFMNIHHSNPCIRCGTQRVVKRSWKEKIDNSIIINTQTICPNKDCQKKVDFDIKKQKDKNTAMRVRNEQRILDRKMGRKPAVYNKTAN